MSYTEEEEVENMRHELAMHDIETLGTDSLYDIMREGCKGYDHYSNAEIRQMHADIVGEEKEV